MGSDLEEVDEVCREYKRKRQDNPVDYALFIHRSPILFVEAKGLDCNLEDRKWVSQTLSYATVVGVEWCVLTNGDEYRLYNSHAAVDVDEKLFRAVRISNVADEGLALDALALLSKERMGDKHLSVLWKVHFIDRRIKAAVEKMWRVPDDGLIRLIRKEVDDLRPTDVKESLKRADIKVNFPVVSGLLPVPTPEKVTAVRTPKTAKAKVPSAAAKVELSDLIGAGLIAPPLGLQRTYKGNTLRATVQADGMVVFDGHPHSSLSTAAIRAKQSVIGKRLSTNGWDFWQYRDDAAGKLMSITQLRDKLLKRGM